MALITNTLVAAIVVLLLVYVVPARVKAYNRLAHIKGPPTTGWSKAWLVRNQFGGKLCTTLIDVARKYGK